MSCNNPLKHKKQHFPNKGPDKVIKIPMNGGKLDEKEELREKLIGEGIDIKGDNFGITNPPQSKDTFDVVSLANRVGDDDWIQAKKNKVNPKGIAVLRAKGHTVNEPAKKKVAAVLKKIDNKKVLTDTEKKGFAEGLGEIGGAIALERLGIKDSPLFINRYHGPDSIGYDKNGEMTESEFKGVSGNSTAISTNKKGQKQLSREKNKKRSKTFVTNKSKEIGKKTTKIGGPHTENELKLNKEIYLNEGEKNMISIHTNVINGNVRVIERDSQGKIVKDLDKFNIYGG